MSTLTTVGYGDLSPQSVLGRIVGIALMVIGIGFVALLTGAIATRFIGEHRATESPTAEPAYHEIAQELRRVGDRLAQLEARPARERDPTP